MTLSAVGFSLSSNCGGYRKKAGRYYFSPSKNNKSRVLALAPPVIRLFRSQKLKQNGMRLQAGELWMEKQSGLF
ncbi:hypothetical protein OBV_38150 [Oscillibacter valericigenes Sjm18-20]|nr:hypothetical protein OBV_38150 [Oscillibacter valericigenes Sjm18-20]